MGRSREGKAMINYSEAINIIKINRELTDEQLGELIGIKMRTVQDARANSSFKRIHYQSLLFALRHGIRE